MGTTRFGLVFTRARTFDHGGSPPWGDAQGTRRGWIAAIAPVGTLRLGKEARAVDRALHLYPPIYPLKNHAHQPAGGIDDVRVWGTLVGRGSEHSGALPGRVLRQRYRPGQ